MPRKKKTALPGKPGRPPSPMTTLVRDGIQAVYRKLGGHSGFARWAREHPTEFYKALMRGLPREADPAKAGHGLTIVVRGNAEVSSEGPRDIEGEVVNGDD